MTLPLWAQAPTCWFYPAHSGPDMVNVALTPERVLNHPDPSWQNQVILWEGRVLRHSKDNCQDNLILGTTAGNVSVNFPHPARNLELSRRGYRVAIKGNLHLDEEGNFLGLTGRSCILLEAPLDKSYPIYLQGSSPTLESFLTWRILFHNPQTPQPLAEEIASKLLQHCQDKEIPPSLLASLIQIESAWDIDAVSKSGAQGLGQLMPKTAAGLNVADPLDPLQNLEGCSTMVSRLLKSCQEYPNPYASVLASYNAGPTVVRSLNGQVPECVETTNYVYFIGYVRQDMLRLAKKYGLELE